MQDPKTPKRTVTIQISSNISAQGAFLRHDRNGMAVVDTGSGVVRGKLLSTLEQELAQ
jgi:outer membrane biogenesis lipoprotein LolB